MKGSFHGGANDIGFNDLHTTCFIGFQKLFFDSGALFPVVAAAAAAAACS